MVDLIYTDVNKQDIGVLNEYAFDCAYGKDENNFELIMPRTSPTLSRGCLVYVENSEIGGIIDVVGVNTKDKQTIYKGRTWHGILNEKVIEPDVDQEFAMFSGEANSVIADIITACDVGDLFEASAEDSGFQIENYTTRYGSPIFEISTMLHEVTAKLKMVYDGATGKVKMSAVPYIDYSLDEEWSASKKDFEAEKTYLPVNHLLCLGSGEGTERYVIHLFADEAGNIQPYATVESPEKDADYILDKSMQDEDLTGMYERTEIYSQSASAVKNYVLTTSEPADYEENYEEYYTYDEENDKYEQVKKKSYTRYQILTTKPSDWDTNFEDYYTRNGENYSRASLDTYEAVSTQPIDWEESYVTYYTYDGSKYHKVTAITTSTKHSVSAKKAKKCFKNGQYKNLYTRTWDGTQWVYEQVSDVSYDSYKMQSKRPSDWTNNFNHYYQKKKKAKGYETVKGIKKKQGNSTVTVAPTWKKKKYYTKYSKQKKPAYNKNKTYYQEVITSSTPSWSATTYYQKLPNTVNPTFHANSFYLKVKEEYIPPWDEQDIYKQWVDHYANLVEEGVKRLKELQDCDSIEISLKNDIEYDIGDVVGAVDEITGLEIWQPITKKTITISRHKKVVEYEIGGEIYGNGSSYR